MNSDTLLIMAGIGAALILGTRGRVGSYVGQSVGETAGGLVSGSVTGLIEGTLVRPYEWAQSYEGYIPIIDDAAKAAVWIKELGDDDKWFW